MSTTSSDGPYGATGPRSNPSMSTGSTSESTLSSGADYYGANGATYASGSSIASGGSSGTPSTSDWSSTGSVRPSGSSDTDSTSLSRGAVTSRTGPLPRTPGPAATAASDTATQSTARTAPRKHKGPRRVRLAVARVDPWSVMKMSFLLAVALGIAGVVLTAVLWMILSTMNVFTDIEGVLQSLQTTTSEPFSIKDYVGFGRVVSLSIVIGVIDVILLTAISTVMAFLYNICSALVGGIQLTLTDD